MSALTPEDRMTIAAARLLRDRAVVFVGIGLPEKEQLAIAMQLSLIHI